MKSAFARLADGTFSPLDRKLEVGAEGYSTRLLRKIEFAGANLSSFVRASEGLLEIGEHAVSPKHVQRITERLGAERAALRDRTAERFKQGKLKPAKPEPPVVVAVHVDAGKIQLRQEDGAPGVRTPRWVDAKVASCVSYAAPKHEKDPQPEPPRAFLDPPSVVTLCREIEHSRGPAEQRAKPEVIADAARAIEKLDVPLARASTATPRRDRPKPLVRTAVATLKDAATFGWLAAAEAWRRGFFQAPRRALVGDGGNWIGPLAETHFPGWYLVLDFVHLLVHLFRAAGAAHPADPVQAWRLYVELLRDAWKGRATRVIQRLEAEVARLRSQHKPPLAALDCLRLEIDYVRGNRDRMDYPRYRREGLPVSSASVESLIKQFNLRVKGTEKTWTRSGAEAILQSRAAYLSQDDRAARHFTQRPRARAAHHGGLSQAA